MWLKNEEPYRLIKETWVLLTGAMNAAANLGKKTTERKKNLTNWEKRYFGNIIAGKGGVIKKHRRTGKTRESLSTAKRQTVYSETKARDNRYTSKGRGYVEVENQEKFGLRRGSKYSFFFIKLQMGVGVTK